MSTRPILRAIAAIGFGAVVGLALERVASWAWVSWYMATYSIANRSELANDYGFGVVGLLVSIASLCVGFVMGAIGAWFALRNRLGIARGA